MCGSLIEPARRIELLDGTIEPSIEMDAVRCAKRGRWFAREKLK